MARRMNSTSSSALRYHRLPSVIAFNRASQPAFGDRVQHLDRTCFDHPRAPSSDIRRVPALNTVSQLDLLATELDSHLLGEARLAHPFHVDPRAASYEPSDTACS